MLYYHAGVIDGASVVWSDHTRRTRETARREARRMASKLGWGTPVVEWWDRSRGLNPGDCDAVLGCEEVIAATPALAGSASSS